jgi:hypothetical protein
MGDYGEWDVGYVIMSMHRMERKKAIDMGMLQEYV